MSSSDTDDSRRTGSPSMDEEEAGEDEYDEDEYDEDDEEEDAKENTSDEGNDTPSTDSDTDGRDDGGRPGNSQASKGAAALPSSADHTRTEQRSAALGSGSHDDSQAEESEDDGQDLEGIQAEDSISSRTAAAAAAAGAAASHEGLFSAEPPPFQLHPWQRLSSQTPVDCRSLEDKLAEAKQRALQCAQSSKQRALQCAQSSKGERCTQYWTRALALSTLLHGDQHLATAEARQELAEAYMELRGYAPQALLHSKAVLKMLRSSGDGVSEAPSLPRDDGGGGSGGGSVVSIVLPISHTQASGSQSETDLGGSRGGADVMLVPPPPSRDHIKFRALLCLGRAQIKLKKWPSAVATLQVADDQHRRLVQTTGCCEVNDIVLLAMARSKALASSKEVKRASEVLQKALSYCEELSEHGGKEAMVELLFHLSSIYATAGWSDDAAEVLAQLRPMLRKSSRTASQLAECELQMAKLSAEDAKAEGHLKKALKILQRLHGTRHAKPLAVQEELAIRMVRRGKHQESIAMVEEVLANKEMVFGDYSVEVGKSQQLLGNLHLACGNIKDSLTHLNKAYELLSSLLGYRCRHVEDLKKTIDKMKR